MRCWRRALDEAISTALNRLGGADECAPLTWRLEDVSDRLLLGSEFSQVDAGAVVTGQAGAEYRPDEVADVLAAWAGVLGLHPAPPIVSGTLEYRGLVAADRLFVTVWGVVDHHLFETGAAAAVGAVPG